ncbi:MAG: enoyl-CoA hydratase [Hahellaceae bacterium]|nr:enoyl-CoA hydratase [Hahellaceae bacterium]MCP5210665.1 enoyl-CoA hydratase [Hahellaceae bacterium]
MLSITDISSPSSKLLLEFQEHTAIITINNPAANTWDEESLPALQEIIQQLNQCAEIYALVITGQGEKFFSAGADLKLFADGDKARARKMARLFGEAFETLGRYRGVSIAAINGYAMGGGLECALACDLRIAEEHAHMALPEASVGLLPCAGGTQNLPWLVGEGWAKRMILCGERVNAETALKIGLIEEIVAPGDSKAQAIALAARVARQSPSSVTACKKLIMAARGNPMQLVLPKEREYFVDLFDTEDQKEGVNAFLDKRKADWKNK